MSIHSIEYGINEYSHLWIQHEYLLSPVSTAWMSSHNTRQGPCGMGWLSRQVTMPDRWLCQIVSYQTDEHIKQVAMPDMWSCQTCDDTKQMRLSDTACPKFNKFNIFKDFSKFCLDVFQCSNAKSMVITYLNTCRTHVELASNRILFITTRVCSTREGNIYTWKCLSVHFWGGPRSRSR